MKKQTLPVIFKCSESVKLREQLGPFEYEPKPEPDGVKVQKVARREQVSGKTKENNFNGSSGWEYEGEINLEGKRHGRVVMVWTNGSIYEGYWKTDK